MTENQDMNREADLITRGDEAEALLNNETFTSVVDGLVQEVFQGFVNSPPDAGDKREQQYHHYRALVDIVNTLRQRVAVRDQIMAENDDSDSNGEE